MGSLLAVASILGTVGSTVAGIANTNSVNNANARNTAATNKSNLQLAREQMQFTRDMYHENNEYNTPKEQVKRLQDAGLSAAAAASSVAGVPASQPQSVDLANQIVPPPVQGYDFSGISGANMVGLARQLEALRKEKSEADITEAENLYSPPRFASEAAQKLWAAKTAQARYNQLIESWPTSFQGMKYEVAGKRFYGEQQYIATMQAKQDYEQAKELFGWTTKIKEQEFNELIARIKNMGAEYDNLLKQGKNIDANTRLVNAQTENVEQNTENLETINEGNKLQNLITDLRTALVKAGEPLSAAEKMAALVASGKVPFSSVADFLSKMHQVVKYGHEVYGENSDYMDQYIDVIFDPATSDVNKFGLYQAGNFRQGFRGIQNFFMDN